MKYYNIIDEAEAIATQYALRKPDYVNIPDTDWAVMSEETKGFLIHSQQLVKSLEDAFLKVAGQRDRERELLFNQRIEDGSHLLSSDPEPRDERQCWAVMSEETKGLLVHIQQLGNLLDDVFLEAVKQRDWERELLLYQKIEGKPQLFSINPELYDELEFFERETEFIISAKIWISEVEKLL